MNRKVNQWLYVAGKAIGSWVQGHRIIGGDSIKVGRCLRGLVDFIIVPVSELAEVSVIDFNKFLHPKYDTPAGGFLRFMRV